MFPLSRELQGVRKFITATIADDLPKTSDWYNFLLNLKKRNLNVILYANIPNNKQLKDAFSLAFPESEIFISCFEPINKILKYFSWNYSSKIFSSIKNIYSASSKEMAIINKDYFLDKYKDNKTIIKHVNEYLDYIMPLFDLPINIRNYIYTNNIA